MENIVNVAKGGGKAISYATDLFFLEFDKVL